MIELAEQQRQERSKPASVVIDPRTRREYVLLHRKVCARMRAIFDEEGPDGPAVGVLVDRAMREEDEGGPTLAFHPGKYGSAGQQRREWFRFTCWGSSNGRQSL